MEINRLKWFQVVERTGGIRSAAELLGISPGALSKSMRALENEIGTRLFIPSGRKIEITADGRRIARLADAVIQSSDRLLASAQDANQPQLKIATFEVFSTHFMAQAMKQFPMDGVWHLQELGPGRIEQAVSDGIADYGLTYAPVPHPKLDFLKIGSFRSAVFGRKELQDRYSFEDLPFVAPCTTVSGSATGITSLDGWPVNRFPRKVLFHFEMLESAFALARQGIAALYCPVFVARLQNDGLRPSHMLMEIRAPEGFPKKRASIYLVKRRSNPEDTIVRWLARAVRALCQSA